MIKLKLRFGAGRALKSSACFGVFAFPVSVALASVQPAVRMPKFETLEKLTVGPDNHFQVAIGGNEERMYFTRSSNLATRLFWRGLKGVESLGQVQAFVKAEFDTKDPAISFDGSRIAFTSFERQARGDICVQDVNATSGSKQLCAEEKTASEQPFWLSATNVGFIRRPVSTGRAQLVDWNIRTNEKRIILEDQIFSAHADAQGRWVVFASVADNKSAAQGELDRVLKVHRIKDSKTWALKIALPGLSGFPHFDAAGEAVYFAQFSNDTNADARIDGNDNGVLFRIPSTRLEDGHASILPEQLTTAEQNCNYPAPGSKFLYMTCAFEGTLDVYRIPKAGLVPAAWNEKTLLDAYRTSRSIAERTLLLNTLRYRFENYRNADSFEKIFSQHFLTGEYQAALYYLDFVVDNAPAFSKQGYAVLRHILEILQYRALEKLDQISPEFVALLEGKKRIFLREKGAFRDFADLAQTYVELSMRENKKARDRFVKASLSRFKTSLEQYVYFSLSRTMLDENLMTLGDWYRLAVNVAQSPVLTDESRAYVSSVIIAKVAETKKAPADRLAQIQLLRTGAAAGSILDTLLATQDYALKIALAENEADEDKAFQGFNGIFAKTTDQYYLNRALAVQAVLTLAEFNKSRVMQFVASNWLAAAKLSDTEFMHARDQYVSVVLDKAYSLWAKSNPRSASQVFYSSVRLTDDQEAHLGFVTTMLQDNNRKLLDERYASLKSGTFTGSNVDFAKAVILLFDDLSAKDRKSEDKLKEASKILMGIVDDGTRPAGKHLLLGYISHEMLLRRMKGFTFDQELSQTAHHQYMIALDLARKSPRLTARILQNLAMLHLQTGNFGLASGYFAARNKSAFESEQERLSVLWHFSKALYRNGEFPAAAEVSVEGFKLAQKLKSEAEILNGWNERAAFHLSQSGKFAEAAEMYAALLARIEKRNDENVLKALFMQGWSLMKAGRIKQASAAFDKALTLAGKSKSRKPSGEPGDVVEFQPERYSALAYGFLTQMSNTPEGRIVLRENRMKIMRGWEKSLKSFSLSQENWDRFVLKDCSAQAVDYWLAKNPEKSVKQMEECLMRASKAVEKSGESADESILETLRVSWMLSARFKEKNLGFSAAVTETYLNLSRRALSKLDTIAAASRPMANRWLRLKAEQTGLRTIMKAVSQREFLSKKDSLAELQQIGGSDRLELLNAEERQALAEHLGRIRAKVEQHGLER
jgi:hypothetical protein